MKRLGVNIDHVATVRNARGEIHPDPYKAALFVKEKGADSITIHLREDRRHIRDLDAKKICSIKKLLVNLEISTNNNIVKNALKIKPKFICIVPENRNEITTEGGLDLKKNKNKIKKIISKFKKKKIRTSLFINPNIKDIYLSKEIGAECIEIHTGHFSNLVKSKKNKTPNEKTYDPNILKAQERIENMLGLKVKIFNKRNNSGKITIEYKNLDQFELVSDLLTKD